MKIKLKDLGEQVVSMNTEALVRKIGAFSLLEKVSENMKQAFAPYVEPLLPIVTEYMGYEGHKVVKKFAFRIFKNMLVAVGEPQNISLFQQSFPLFVDQANKHFERKMRKKLKIIVKSLADCLRALNKTNQQSRQFLTQEQINALGPMIKNTLALVTALRSATMTVIS